MNGLDAFGTQTAWPDGTALTDDRVVVNGKNYVRDLTQGMQNTVLVGLVITKQEKRSFEDKKNPGTTRSHLHFTLRDTPTDFINVSCWGSNTHISNLAKAFKINDVVEIRNAQVQAKRNTESEERWSPWTPSGFQLSVNESHSSVSLYSGWDINDFDVVAHVPIKASNDFYTLGDIIANGQSLHGEHINIMAAVRNIGKPRDITTKTGRQVKRCEIKLFDDTVSSFPLIIWDAELVELSQTWLPKDFILFIADVKVTFDNFKKAMVATCDSKTIITTNPDTREAQQLFKYTQTVDIVDDDLERSGDDAFEISNIQDIFTVSQVLEKLLTADEECVPQEVTGIIYAFVTELDLDNERQRFIATRCGSCGQKLDGPSEVCINPNCSASNNGDAQIKTDFEISSSFSDHTGMVHCRMKGKCVESLLGCTATEFLNFTQTQATDVKFKFLLERCKVYFKIVTSGKRWLRVLSCSLADHQETANVLQNFLRG
ncbi:meiosis-specific with OB domain-containing protein-like [Actinia tenebrosa]|uniref:Meiosis-specific with OB domain-containing protein-like n=1 Tax=Actinia tenebrosa TaxID=6105 RepID=A0A6P8HTF2_ACTTE|nr:meiosis-specific with OB domain-containing protein-like [Actinia tenebrosa]